MALLTVTTVNAVAGDMYRTRSGYMSVYDGKHWRHIGDEPIPLKFSLRKGAVYHLTPKRTKRGNRRKVIRWIIIDAENGADIRALEPMSRHAARKIVADMNCAYIIIEANRAI